MKAIEQYFPVVLFMMLYKMVLPFASVDEILKCDDRYDHTEKPLFFFFSAFLLFLFFISFYKICTNLFFFALLEVVMNTCRTKLNPGVNAVRYS